MASPVAGPSSTTPNPRRASISQPPVIRRISEGPDSRPKREIHPPPSKDLAYADGASRKPKRRNDPQLQWASRSLIGFEKSPKYYDAISPFLYPVSQIIAELPAYATIIKRPIDLVQIKERLSDGDYEDVSQVNADLRLMIANAMKFNPPGHAVHQAAQQFLQAWDEKWRTCPPKQEVRDASDDPLADFDADSEEEECEHRILDDSFHFLIDHISPSPPYTPGRKAGCRASDRGREGEYRDEKVGEGVEGEVQEALRASQAIGLQSFTWCEWQRTLQETQEVERL